MGWGEGEMAEMEAKKVSHVAKLQKVSQWILHTHTRPRDLCEKVVRRRASTVEEKQPNRGVKRMRDHVVVSILCKPWCFNKIITPKTTDLRRMLSDPWLKRRALRSLLDDCFRIMGPQNMSRLACGRKWSHNHNAVIHYSHKFSQLLLDSLQ